MTRRMTIFSLVVLFALTSIASAQDANGDPAFDMYSPQSESPHAVVKINLAGYDETAKLVDLGSGEYIYVIEADDGTPKILSPIEFSRMVYEQQSSRSWWLRILNISSHIGIAWVTVGLLGQLLFTGRMLVQWLVSEKEKRSVVPPVFWWMSLLGATMLLIYFGWRKDIVGILGQATGWFIYVRNLYFIKRTNNETTDEHG